MILKQRIFMALSDTFLASPNYLLILLNHILYNVYVVTLRQQSNCYSACRQWFKNAPKILKQNWKKCICLVQRWFSNVHYCDSCQKARFAWHRPLDIHLSCQIGISGSLLLYDLFLLVELWCPGGGALHNVWFPTATDKTHRSDVDI